MKLLLALAILAVSATSFASESWAKRPTTLGDYDASRSYIVAWPTVVFDNISVPVKNVCDNGSTLKTATPVEFCSQMAVVEVCTKANSKNAEETCRKVKAGETPVEKFGTRLVWGCVAHKTESFETSKFYQASVCVKWEQVQTGSHNNTVWKCVEMGSETKEYATSYNVSVTAQSTSNHGGSRVEVANLPFAIPACK